MDQDHLNRLREALGDYEGLLPANNALTFESITNIIRILRKDLQTLSQWYSNALLEIDNLKGFNKPKWSAEDPIEPGYYLIMELGRGEIEPAEVVKEEEGLRVWILGEPSQLQLQDIAWWHPMDLPNLPGEE